METSLEVLKKYTEFAASLSVLLAAIAGFIKFRLFNVFGHRWESSIDVSEYQLECGDMVIDAKYKIVNTGQRPLRVKNVEISIKQAAYDEETKILGQNNDQVLARRVIADEQNFSGHLDIQPGERSIFTLRCRLDESPEISFVEGCVVFSHKRRPAKYVAMHVRPSGGAG